MRLQVARLRGADRPPAINPARIVPSANKLAAKLRQIEQHEKLGAQQAEETAAVIAQRVALEKQVAEQAATLEAIKSELDGLRQGGGKKFAAISEERDKVLADLQQTRKELADKIEQIEFQQSLSSKSAEDAAKLAAERESLQKELATKGADLDAITAELGLIKKDGDEKFASVSAERDRVSADLDQARKELTEKRGQVEFQQGLSARSAEESARLAAERESLQGEVTAKSAELETLKSELHEFRTGSGKQFEAVAGERDNIRAELAGAQQELAAKSAQLGALASELESHKKGGEKLSAVAQERDALHKQKTMLAAQLEQATANLAAKQKAVVEVDLSRKENQRHLEELQRRISGFESGQRATSQELTRERETRIKAERSLAAAERTRQEATAMIESMRSETKRESDATTRKRDADVARAQKELQERIETLTEAHRKALAERDERVQEIEKLRAESAAAIETTKSATAAEAAQWEKRAVAGLEDDIAKYRDRIKALLLERDTAAEAAKAQVETLSRERDVVAEKLAHAISEHDKSAAEHNDAFERLQGKGSTIEQGKEAALHQLEQARMAFAERTEQLTAAQAAAENAKGIVAELREQITKLSGERDSVQADWEKLFAELEEARSQTKRQSEEFASLRIDLEQAGGKELSELRVHAGDLQQALDAVSGERDELHKKLESAQADIKRTESEHASLLATHQSASVDFARNLQEHEKTVAGLRSEIGELRSALDERLLKEHELQKQIEESSAQLDHAASEHARQIADIRAEHDEQFATHQATSSNLAKAEAEHEKIVADLKREIEQSKHTLDAFAGERGTLQNDLAAAMSLLDQARAEHDTQVSALRQEHTDALSKREENEIKLSASLEEQEGCVAGLRREIDDLRGALDARTQVEQDLQRKVREASEQLAGAESERAAQISKLQAEHERDLTSQQTKAGDLANAVAEREETITRLSTEIDESKGSLGALAGEREKIQKDLDAAMSLLDQTRSEHDANVSKLDAEHAGALSKHDEQVAALTTALKEHEQTASGLRGEIDTLKKSVAAGTGERGQIQKKLEAARAEIKKAKAENDKQLASINAEHAALAEAHRETTSELAALALAHRNAVDGLQDDMQQRIAVATADGEKTKGEYEAKLAETRGKHSTLLAEHVRVSEEFTRTIRGHEGTLAALREELSTARTEGSRELAESKSAHELEKAQFAKEERAFNETKKKLENKLADAERATAEIAVRAQALDTTVRARESAIAERDAEVVRSKKDGESALAALSREHAAGLDSMTAEKDRQLAALTVDRAKTVAALTRERDELLTKLEGVEETLTARIAALTDERNESIRESTTLAQRLASIAVESDRKIEELERTHAEANDERRALAAELETAKEAHKAQSGVFAREFKGVVKQRDDVAGALEAARTEIQEKATALAREKANLERVESDVAARFEREATRMRRERDVLIRQRDELHSRITKMVEEQRELLEELNSQSVRHTPTPNDIIQPSRAAKQTNVIEITAAQIVPDVESDRGINLPRIRPVLIPPPNVRIL